MKSRPRGSRFPEAAWAVIRALQEVWGCDATTAAARAIISPLEAASALPEARVSTRRVRRARAILAAPHFLPLLLIVPESGRAGAVRVGWLERFGTDTTLDFEIGGFRTRTPLIAFDPDAELRDHGWLLRAGPDGELDLEIVGDADPAPGSTKPPEKDEK